MLLVRQYKVCLFSSSNSCSFYAGMLPAELLPPPTIFPRYAPTRRISREDCGLGHPHSSLDVLNLLSAILKAKLTYLHKIN